MAINKNHEFEELDGIKCSIVEKNASKERVEFLKSILEFNKYTVVVISSPAAKTVPVKPSPAEDAISVSSSLPETFTIGVSDVMFNPTNAIFGRLLRTKDGHVVTLAYWQQKENISNDEVPYFQKSS